MVTTAALIDLVRRVVLRPDEPVEWVKEYPDGPAAYVETSERSLSIRTVRSRFRVELAPWVAALVVVTREDLDVGSPPRRVFLLPEDGEPIDLADKGHVAALGRRLRDGSMDPVAYAEILVEYQWTANGVREVVTDPAAPWPDLPAGALDLPAVRPPKTWDDDHGDRWLAFAAVRRDPDAPDQGVEVTLWSVRVPRDGPASWVCQRS